MQMKKSRTSFSNSFSNYQILKSMKNEMKLEIRIVIMISMCRACFLNSNILTLIFNLSWVFLIFCTLNRALLV